MEYMSVAEAAQKWGLTPRNVQIHCEKGNIPGQDVFILGLRQFGHVKLAEKAEAEQKPVSDAKIEARFDPALQSAGEVKVASTDTNGMAIVTGKTGKSVTIRATKPWYYGASDKICYVSLGQGVKEVR